MAWCGTRTLVCLAMISVYESRAGQGCFLTLCAGGKLPLDPVRLGVTGRWGQGNGPLSGASGRVGGERKERQVRQGATWGPLMSGQDQRVQICRPERPQAPDCKAKEDGLGGGGCGMRGWAGRTGWGRGGGTDGEDF